MRSTTITFFVIACVVWGILYKVKYEVIDLENRHIKIKKAIQSTKESIHILKAEWAHLTDPHRIQKLAFQYLPNGQMLGMPADMDLLPKTKPIKKNAASKLKKEETQKEGDKKPVKKTKKKAPKNLNDLLQVDAKND